MIINVTQEDIDNGKHAKGDQCPVALAIKRQTRATDVAVAIGLAALSGLPRWKYFPFLREKYGRLIPLPKKANTFITNYDAYNDSQPFSFELPI